MRGRGMECSGFILRTTIYSPICWHLPHHPQAPFLMSELADKKGDDKPHLSTTTSLPDDPEFIEQQKIASWIQLQIAEEVVRLLCLIAAHRWESYQSDGCKRHSNALHLHRLRKEGWNRSQCDHNGLCNGFFSSEADNGQSCAQMPVETRSLLRQCLSFPCICINNTQVLLFTSNPNLPLIVPFFYKGGNPLTHWKFVNSKDEGVYHVVQEFKQIWLANLAWLDLFKRYDW